MAQSWAGVNKFRLVTVVMLSLLTSVAAAAGRGYLDAWSLVGMIAQMGIAGFAFMQCPSDRNN